MEAISATGDPEGEIRRSLEILDGTDTFAYSIWAMPEGSSWPDPIAPEWPHEFLQSAGSADRMSIEIRRIENGEPRQYAVGRNGPRDSTPDQLIIWGPNSRELQT
jgi:hypothetical protein